jgi:hypothetical protein
MDQKGFDLFQSAIQWVADEMNREMGESRAYPMSHNQGFWAEGTVTGPVEGTYQGEEYHMLAVCPTAGCVAGNIVTLHGDTLVGMDPMMGLGVTRPTFMVVEHCLDDGGEMHAIAARARELVGMTASEARALFSGENSRENVIQLAQVIARNHGFDLTLM